MISTSQGLARVLWRALAVTTVIVALASVATGPVRAGVIYDFVCTAPTADCAGDDQFGGFIEFSEAAVTAGSFAGTADNWLDFFFTSGDKGGLTWTLAGISDNVASIAFMLTGDRDRIMSIDDTLGTSTTFVTGLELLSIVDSTCQNVACEINDLGGTGFVTGEWVRRAAAVPEPSTLGLLGAGLLALTALRRRRRG